MTLLDGEILWNLVWILPLLGVLFYWSRRRRSRLLKRFLGGRASDPAVENSSGTLRFWRGVLFAGVLILLVAAAARPSWGFRILPYSGQGRDLMLVFDVSKSMLSCDVRPSRLEHAKWLARQLCERNPGDRFGLIAFAGHAFLECPLTIDKTSFLQSVDDLSADTIPVGGTNIQQALTEAIRGFRAAETPHRAVILITDGDELTGDSSKALDEIVRLKIPLFILGVGDPSQPAIVQLRDEKGNVQTLKDRSGNVVSVPLNERMLSGLARKTGGVYVRSTTTHPGIEQIEARIRKLEKHEIDSGKQTRPIERPLYPLLGAFVLFCIWLMLGERKKICRPDPVKFWLILGLAGMVFGCPAKEVPHPEKAPSSAAPVQAPAEKEKTAAKETLSPEELFNAGLKAQTQENDPGKAVQLYEQAIAAVHSAPEVRSRSAQNLGVMNHQKARAMLQQALQTVQAQQLDPALQQIDTGLKQLDAAEEVYRDSLREGADTSAVSRNQYQLIQDRKKAEELKKKIEELKKQQQEARQNTQKAMDQQKQNQDQKQNKDQKQDQQNNNQNQQNKDQQKQDQPQDQKQQNIDQQKQDRQQNQQNDRNQTDKARESVRQLEQQARDLNQKKMEDQAKKAGEELDQARQAQERKQDSEAEKHLKKALDHLGKEQDQQNKEDRQDKQDKGKDRKDQPKPDPQQGKDKQLPEPGQGKPQNAKPEPEKEIDKDQAGSLLDLMAGDEKKLKDELKARMKRNYGTRPVEKDW